MITLNIPVTPMGAVRMTGRGKFVNKNAQRYLAYKDFIKWEVKKQMKSEPFESGALHVDITFVIPIPKSWSKKKQQQSISTLHTKKPDIDNLIKGVFDALNKIAWKDDNQVSEVTACKKYGEKPGIEVQITRATEEWEQLSV
ncbi:RusA family crossover junction endodeoxyribonuclease [Bacillus sp. CLL-7-23]|uniref:RusA family crossover junction endodeoxyribonuclease n=1 Tax=Bacillus changyiensis TaxID=3004103 RepID=A0ABT4X8L5_9BACI|nr:RusA family crossover junction endodeoxyribonuclease [Bacillus changyiensis]MDA7028635.1 RusA family crossover junction endodeoxyribonuclease [Bacillus changyiensis]